VAIHARHRRAENKFRSRGHGAGIAAVDWLRRCGGLDRKKLGSAARLNVTRWICRWRCLRFNLCERNSIDLIERVEFRAGWDTSIARLFATTLT
jgi:hypothetical protein